MLTVNGRVAVRRRGYQDRQAGHRWPVDEWSGLARRTVSLGAQALICRLNQSAGSFGQAAQNLWEAARLGAGKELVRRTVEGQGRAVVEARQSGVLAPGWRAADCVESVSGRTRVYLGCDGVLVPMVTAAEKAKRKRRLRAQGKKAQLSPGADQSYKEMKLVAFYDQEQRRMHCVATRRDHRAAGVIMSREGRRLGLKQAQEKVAVVDGAVWIRGRIDASKLRLDAVCLDFYHLAQHVHQTRREVWGEESHEGVAWAAQRLHQLKHEGFEVAWEELCDWRGRLRRPTQRRAADRLLQYMSQRREMIQYPRFLGRGWQIGSGPTEALCKTTTLRLKGRGRRWDAANAEAVMALSTLHSSGLWDNYWRLALTTAA
jgi:hypothetical protein